MIATWINVVGSGGEREKWTDSECVMELTSFTEVLAVGCEERRIISDGTEDSRRRYYLLK